MTWALVDPKKKSTIYKTAEKKYDLLKWGVELKEPVSKKTLKNFKEGDIITVVFRKTFEKWFTDPQTKRYYKDNVTEVNERQYMLVRIVPETDKNPWKEAAELMKKENKELKAEVLALRYILGSFIQQAEATGEEDLQKILAEAKKLLAGKANE